MCLYSIDETKRRRPKKIWKIVYVSVTELRKYRRSGKVPNTYYSSVKTAKFQLGRIETATPVALYPGEGGVYESGFHGYLTLSDAKRSKYLESPPQKFILCSEVLDGAVTIGYGDGNGNDTVRQAVCSKIRPVAVYDSTGKKLKSWNYSLCGV